MKCGTRSLTVLGALALSEMGLVPAVWRPMWARLIPASPLRWMSRRSNSREVRRQRSQVPHWPSRELCRLAPHNQRSLPPQKAPRNRVRPASTSSHKAPTRAATVSGLACTGADAGPAIGIGILLAALGGGLILVSRRRRRRS